MSSGEREGDTSPGWSAGISGVGVCGRMENLCEYLRRVSEAAVEPVA